MSERLEPENLIKALGADRVIKLPEKLMSFSFDGIAIAWEIRRGLSALIKSKNDPAFEEKVKVAYEEAKEKLKGSEYGGQILEALGDSFKEGRLGDNNTL